MASPLGIGARRSWLALLESKIGIQQLKQEHSFEGCNSRVAAYVPEDQLSECLKEQKHTYIAKHVKQLSKATILAMVATHEALEDSKLLNQSLEIHEPFRNTAGVAIGQGMVDFEDIHQSANVLHGKTQPGGFRRLSPYFITRALMNMSAGNISIRYKTRGPNHCVSTACATGAHSIGDAYNFIKQNKANIMICGGAEASVNSLAMAGFERIRALCTDFNDSPNKASRPFDRNRAGFVMGEGSGILILEELEHAKARGIGQDRIYAEVLGYGVSSDAHHLTAPLPDGDGALRCMKSALADANLTSLDISHVNAHSTSTPLGDDIECNAIERLFHPDGGDKGQKLVVNSCKGSIGHLLGAAGSVESIFAILSCKNAIIPHCVNLDSPLETPKGLVNFVRNKPEPWSPARRILVKNSFGFGGTNAALVISNLV